MNSYRIAEDTYVEPTAAGAFHAAASADDEPPRRLLLALMRGAQTPLLEAAGLCAWTALEREEEAVEVLYRAQAVGWVRGSHAARAAPQANFESEVPELLAALTAGGKALLADADGFYLARSGYSHETAEELSALSADLAALHARHAGLLQHNLGQRSSAWALVDAAGDSQLGCWPLYVGSYRFALVVSGVPNFNVPAFVDLVWSLVRRYQ